MPVASVEAHRVSRSVKALVLCVVVAVAAALAVAVEPARACSCLPPDPWALLRQADGAFVGRMMSRREADGDRAILVFSVERAVKGEIGDTVEVETPKSGASCGLETPVGERIGLFLGRDGARWFGNLCAQVAPDDLLAATVLPAPTGSGPAALLVGSRFGPARSMALDAQGRTLAYGLGSGVVSAFSACPGGRRIVEITDLDAGYLVTIRELWNMSLVRRQRIAAESRPHCASVEADRLLAFSGSGPGLERRARLVRHTPSGASTIWTGTAGVASFWRTKAFVQVVEGTSTALVAVDARTGATQRLGVVPDPVYELVPNGAGALFAGDSYDEANACCPQLLVVDVRRRPAAVRRIPLPAPFGSTVWLSNDRFAYLGRPFEALVYTPALRLVARFRGWNATLDTVGSGGSLFGLRADGALITARPPSGRTRIVRRLPGKPSVIASAIG